MTCHPQIAKPGCASPGPSVFSPESPMEPCAQGPRDLNATASHRAAQPRPLRLVREEDDDDEEPDDEDDDWDDFEAAQQGSEPPWEVWDPLDDEPAEPDQRDFWPDLPDDDD